MTRTFITRKKFYDIRRSHKRQDFPFNTEVETAKHFEVSRSTVFKILKARNFKEYKQLVNLYSRTMKKLKRKYLFILAVIAVILVIINLLIK